MKTTAIAVMAVGSIALIGCASDRWIKEGVTEAEMESDATQCHAEASRHATTGGDMASLMMSAAKTETAYEACMNEKGYVRP